MHKFHLRFTAVRLRKIRNEWKGARSFTPFSRSKNDLDHDRSGNVMDCHATARGSIPDRNGVFIELHVLRKGQ